MRVWPLFAFTALLALPISLAQTQPAAGSVEFDILPNSVTLRAGEPVVVRAWINATISCDLGSSNPEVEIYPDSFTFYDDEGEPQWFLEPEVIHVMLGRTGGNRFEARVETNLTIDDVETSPEKGRIEFQVTDASPQWAMTGCTVSGTRWQFQQDPFIDVVVEPSSAGPSAGSSQAPVAEEGATFDPSTVVIETGPVGGESHVPGEAFWSLGIVFGLFASSAVYSLRRR